MTPHLLDLEMPSVDETPSLTVGQTPAPATGLKAELEALGAGLPADDDAAVMERAAELYSSLKPINAFEMWLTEEIALNEVRSRRYQFQRTLHRTLAARRAALCWDQERRVAAEELMERLARRPAALSRVLAQTKQGCEALLERWRGLERIWNVKNVWTKAQTSLALDLLGVVKELRDGSDALDDPKSVARREIERLERLLAETLNELDAGERVLAEQGAGAPDETVMQLMRLEAACLRRIHWARKQFKNGRHAYEPWGSTHMQPTQSRRRAPEPRPEDSRAPEAPMADSPAPAHTNGDYHRRT